MQAAAQARSSGRMSAGCFVGQGRTSDLQCDAFGSVHQCEQSRCLLGREALSGRPETSFMGLPRKIDERLKAEIN